MMELENASLIASETRATLARLRSEAALPVAQAELLTSALNAWEARHQVPAASLKHVTANSPYSRSPRRSRAPCTTTAMIDNAADCGGSCWAELPDVARVGVVNALQWKDVGKARLVCKDWARDVAASRESFQLRMQPRCLIAAWAAQLAHRFPSLRRLRIGPRSTPRQGDEGMETEALELPFEPGSAVGSLVSACPRLQDLVWDYPQLSDDGLAALSKLSALRQLQLFPGGEDTGAQGHEERGAHEPSEDEPGHVSFPGLTWLGAMTHLESLSIGRISVSPFLPDALRVNEVPRVIAEIRLLSGLRRLSFGSLGGALDDEMLSWVVQGMPGLEELDCGAAVSVSPPGLGCLRGLRSLRRFTLVDAFHDSPDDDDEDEEDVGFEVEDGRDAHHPLGDGQGLPPLPSLTALELPRSPAVTPAWLCSTLRSNTALQALTVSQATVCFEGRLTPRDDALAALLNISELRLRGCGLTDACLRRLSGLPSLRLLDIGGHQCLTANGLCALPTTLRSLAILGETLAAAAAAAEPLSAANDSPGGNGNNGRRRLLLPGLKDLTLEGSELGFGLRDQDVLCVARAHRGLESLTIVHSRVLSLTVLRSALRTLPSLRELRLKRCPNYMMEADLLRSLKHDLRLLTPGLEISVWHEERRVWRSAVPGPWEAYLAGHERRRPSGVMFHQGFQ